MAIEVSSTTFTVANLWKSFFCSTICILIIKSFGLLKDNALFTADASYFFTGNEALGINHEQPFFALLGVLCGIVGSFYIMFQRKITLIKNANAHRWFVKTTWVYTFIITFVCLNIIWFMRLNQISDKNIIQAMINVDQTLAEKNLNITNYQEALTRGFDFSTEVMNDPSQWVLYDGYLALFVVQKFVFTALTLSCATPGGIFTPMYGMGAVFGQLYVSLLIRCIEFFNPGAGLIQCK